MKHYQKRIPQKLGDWYVYCDICGQRYFASEMTKLEAYTGRGGLIVCPNDADQIDFGLVPYNVPIAKNIPWTRINHQNTTNGTAPLDPETATNIGV